MTGDSSDVLSRNTTNKRHITDGSLIVNQSELQTITDAMGEGLLVVDSQGAFAFMNPAAECLLGWTLDEVKGKHVHNTIHYMKEDGSPFPVDQCKMYENAFNKRTESRETDVLIKSFMILYDQKRALTSIHLTKGPSNNVYVILNLFF